MTNVNARNFDQWIRNRFRDLNTELENLYFAQEDRTRVDGVGDAIKLALCAEGHDLIARLACEDSLGQGFEDGFDLLGNIGFYMSACSRHAISEAMAGRCAGLREAAATAMRLGAGLGVVPRFCSSHLSTHNRAVNGQYKSFTTLPDEATFTVYNMLGILAYKRAAEALLSVVSLDVSHPLSAHLLKATKDALAEVIASNHALFQELDQDRFFYSVLPYYKPCKVGFNTYRGANAGDFAAINAVDLLLGLCESSQSAYAQLLVDKFLYLTPQDQSMLRDCMRHESLMNRFVAALDSQGSSPWFRQNAAAFLEVCELHGRGAIQHHDQLVEKYIKIPASKLPVDDHADLTASGPPLPVLLLAMEKLRDQRAAAPRTDLRTRHDDIQRIKAALNASTQMDA